MIKNIRKTALLVFCGLMLSTLFTSCGKSISDIEQMVAVSMQETFDTDPDFKTFNIKVEEVSVVKSEGNKYEGIATVDYKGTLHNVSIRVTVGDDNLIWKTDKGAFMFLLDDLF